MKRTILLIIFASFFFVGFSQRTAKVSATYTYYAPETMSVEEAKRIAFDRARIQAMADEFGTVVSQSTSIVITNESGESASQFFTLGGSDVKGEWIETIGDPVYNLQFDKHVLVVICTVKGKAREIVQANVDFIAKPLRNGTTLKYESTEFKNGDDLYLYFKSPIDGYLAVYLLDDINQTVYSILPYKSDKVSAYPVIGDKEYVFFSIREADKEDKGKVDEYNLNCVQPKEFNTLFIIFSSSEFNKTTGFKAMMDEIPKNIVYKDFKLWLTKLLAKDRGVHVQEISISISN